jgi:hypothetical protein
MNEEVRATVALDNVQGDSESTIYSTILTEN